MVKKKNEYINRIIKQLNIVMRHLKWMSLALKFIRA